MSRTQRLLCTALLLAGALVGALLLASTPISQVRAQAATPLPGATPQTAPTSLVAATPTPTKTPQELIGVDQPVSWASELWTRFGWWAMPLALIALIGGVGYKYLEGIGENVKERGKKAAERTLVMPRGWRTSPEIRKYLGWLKTEYGSLPQIGVATEQVQLDVETVHVPLRVMERSEAEAHQRQMRGESATDDNRLFQRRGRLGRGRDGGIFSLLSDTTEIKRRKRRAEQIQPFLSLGAGLKRRFQRKPVPRTRLSIPSPVPRNPVRPPPLSAPSPISQNSVQPPSLSIPRPLPRPLEPEQPQTTTRLLLLGGAGSGKTMTLRYAALCCADAYERGNAHALGAALGLTLRRPPLPIYARLTLFANTLPESMDKLTPQERGRYQGAPPDLFLEWLDGSARCAPGALSGQVRRGGCLVLLDGLDESGSEAHRAYLTELITNLAEEHPGNCYVVASRTAGYGGRVQLGGFTERHLSPLDSDEVQLLIGKWFSAVYARLDAEGRRRQAEGAQDQIGKLWGVVERSPRLFEMATNPLLATTMALLQFNNIKLPDQRAKLYEKLVELLLDLWRKTTVGNDTLAASVAQLATEQRRIQHLALQMQLQPTQAREVSLAQAQAWLSPLYAARLNLDREEADARVAKLLESLSIDSGLVQRTQRAERVYSFSHYTFQEYLAARGLDAYDERAGNEDSVAFLLARCGEARWRETLLLAAGQWSNTEQLPKTERLLQGLLDTRTAAADILAGEALADIGAVEELTRLRDAIIARLRALAFDPHACPDARERSRAATLLDRLGGDQRPELDPAQPGYWAARVEPGVFSMGPATEPFNLQKVPSAFTARIRRPYALARFPVTNRLYARYLDDLRRRGAEKEAEQRRPRPWPGRSYRPGEGSHPVIRVTWHDATAFAAWLDAELRKQGTLAPGEQVRLPLETEWERAAAYPAAPPASDPARGRREYPWGAWPPAPTPATPTRSDADLLAGLLGAQGDDDEDEDEDEELIPGPANTRESKIGGTSAVGIFPNGRAGCGAEELCGNVWEWCASAYQDYPLPDELAPETIDNQSKALALRGGDYSDKRTNVPCGARGGSHPGLHFVVIGFRVARLFSSSS